MVLGSELKTPSMLLMIRAGVNIDDCQLKLNTSNCLPFIERDGVYWGTPADDHEAIAELNRMHQKGINFIVFAWPAFWWLDHYKGFSEYLKSKETRRNNLCDSISSCIVLVICNCNQYA